MSALAAGLAAALLLGAPAQKPAAGSPPAVPAIRVEPDRFDFGRTRPGHTLRKEFTLRNAGASELVIQGVSTTCGCTAAIAGETHLKPGRSTPLSVSLQTRDYRGRVERRVLVRSNDPKTPLVELTVSATVEPPPAR